MSPHTHYWLATCALKNSTGAHSNFAPKSIFPLFADNWRQNFSPELKRKSKTTAATMQPMAKTIQKEDQVAFVASWCLFPDRIAYFHFVETRHDCLFCVYCLFFQFITLNLRTAQNMSKCGTILSYQEASFLVTKSKFKCWTLQAEMLTLSGRNRRKLNGDKR